MAKGRADEGAVRGHLGNTGGKVVAMLVAVLGEPRGNELLGTGEGACGEHLGAQRVRLKLLDVGLLSLSVRVRDAACASVWASVRPWNRGSTYRQVALGASILHTTGQSCADNSRDGVVDLLHGFTFELDHGCGFSMRRR